MLAASRRNSTVNPARSFLEEALGKPVVTSNQATLWATSRAASVDDRLEGLGQLFRNH